jgi:hypothetical protein
VKLFLTSVLDVIDERKGVLVENEENIYNFDIIPGQYRVRLLSKDKSPISFEIELAGQSESHDPTTYSSFDSKLFNIPTNSPV